MVAVKCQHLFSYLHPAQVTFVDFGNKETVRGAAVRAISPELSALAPQAQLLQLAFLKVGVGI